MNIRKAIYQIYRHFMLDCCHWKIVDREWVATKGYKVDWENPRDINEKIQWLMCFSDTSLWSLCADKYRVRDYVKAKGFGDMLVPLYGVWDKASEIDFDILPEKFVLKCNHDSGSTVIIDKAAGFDESAVRRGLAAHLRAKYGYVHGEMYYNDIRPCIMAEKYLEPESSVSASQVDYKIWCFGGKPYGILTCHGRTRDSVCLNAYDLEWNVHPEWSVFSEHYRDGRGELPRPAHLDEMLSAASVLSEGFPEVRVDFYEVGGRVYFGELTFSSLCGKMTYYTEDYLRELGRQCILPRK